MLTWGHVSGAVQRATLWNGRMAPGKGWGSIADEALASRRASTSSSGDIELLRCSEGKVWGRLSHRRASHTDQIRLPRRPCSQRSRAEGCRARRAEQLPELPASGDANTVQQQRSGVVVVVVGRQRRRRRHARQGLPPPALSGAAAAVSRVLLTGTQRAPTGTQVAAARRGFVGGRQASRRAVGGRP